MKAIALTGYLARSGLVVVPSSIQMMGFAG